LKKDIEIEPNLFIVGAPKCGTTSLYEYLRQHIDIYLTPVKEPNYFNTDLERPNRISQEKYYQLYDNVKSETVIGEATPLYLMSKEATDNIYSNHPNSKIIILVRKPSEVVYSAFFQNLYNGIETIEDFEEAFKNQHKRRNGYKLPATVLEPIERLEYDRFVNYKEDIPRWIETFGSENVLVLTLSELKENQSLTLSKILDFLELKKEGFQPSETVYNPATTNKNNQLKRFVKSPPKIVSVVGRTFFSQKTRAKLFQFIRKKNEVKLSKPPLDKKFEKELNQTYLLQTEYIENLLNINLNDWKG